MDSKIQSITPNYKRIYSDILNRKHPEKIEDCKTILEKSSLSVLDIIELNHRIFGIVDKSTESFNQKHRSYSESDILQILDYQKRNHLNNSQLASYFKLSRNTIAKWRKMFYTQ